MLAAVYHGPHDLRVEEVPRPTIAPDEVLVQVRAATVCGTDLRILSGGHRHYPPGTRRIPGHEVTGEIAVLGPEVSGYAVGQRVFVAPNMGREGSRATVAGHNNLDPDFQAFGINLDGAFAEFLRVPAAAVRQGNLIPLHDGVEATVGALIEPLACVLRGQNALGVRDGDVVVVMGAGPIGILHVMLARLRGAACVIVSQPSAPRRQKALELGADCAVEPDELPEVVQEESGGRGADVVIVAAPSSTAQEAALRIAAIGGRINFFAGLPKEDSHIRLDANLIHYRELIVTGTTACSTWDCLRAAELVNAGRLDLAPLLTARFPLAEAPAALAAAADGTNLRVALEP